MQRAGIRDFLAMVNYRRANVPGATYFFTVTLRDRKNRSPDEAQRNPGLPCSW